MCAQRWLQQSPLPCGSPVSCGCRLGLGAPRWLHIDMTSHPWVTWMLSAEAHWGSWRRRGRTESSEGPRQQDVLSHAARLG